MGLQLCSVEFEYTIRREEVQGSPTVEFHELSGEQENVGCSSSSYQASRSKWDCNSRLKSCRLYSVGRSTWESTSSSSYPGSRSTLECGSSSMFTLTVRVFTPEVSKSALVTNAINQQQAEIAGYMMFIGA